MRMLRVIAALLILVVTNVFVFAGIAWNRSGEPTGSIVFDQCELNSFKDWSGPHRTARYVLLSFESLKAGEDSLKDLYGSGWEGDEDAKWFEPRLYVVLMHGGPEWQRYLEKNEGRRYKGFSGHSESKLIIVDGSTDSARLQEKYPETEGRAILPGFVSRWYRSGNVIQMHSGAGASGDYYWNSAVHRIAIDSQFRGVVTDIRDARIKLERDARGHGQTYVEPPCSPTHRITVKWGRRFEPWISSIEAF